MLWAAFKALICSANSGTFGGSVPASGAAELVAQCGQLPKVGVMGEGLSQAGLVVAELPFGNGQVLAGGGARPGVAAGQPLDGI